MRTLSAKISEGILGRAKKTMKPEEEMSQLWENSTEIVKLFNLGNTEKDIADRLSADPANVHRVVTGLKEMGRIA